MVNNHQMSAKPNQSIESPNFLLSELCDKFLSVAFFSITLINMAPWRGRGTLANQHIWGKSQRS